MHSIEINGVRIFSLFSYLPLFLLVLLQSAAVAGEAASKPASKAAQSKPRVAAVKPSNKSTVPTPTIVSEADALASFDRFTSEWMEKLARTEEFQRTQRMKVIPSPEGFSAEYVGYLPERYITVKRTDSRETPFIGILTYFERTLRCIGKTKEEALRGPFNQAETNQVSEIFRFTKGKWVY
jgi:hypothetical protein